MNCTTLLSNNSESTANYFAEIVDNIQTLVHDGKL
jgi:hypothetical protein